MADIRHTYTGHDLKTAPSSTLAEMINLWAKEAEKLKSGEITQEEYDRWRYYYPKYDTSQIWAKVPSQEFSDHMVRAFKNRLKED